MEAREHGAAAESRGVADGWYDIAVEGGTLVVEADATDRPRTSVVAALSVCSSVVMEVVPPAEPACRGNRAFNVQRRCHEVDRAARAAASGALLVVAVVAAAARAAATLEGAGQLGIPISRAAGSCQAGVLVKAIGAGKRVAGSAGTWRHEVMSRAARRCARARACMPRLARAPAGAAAAATRDADAARAVARASRPGSCCAKEALIGAATVAAVAAIDVNRARRADCDVQGRDFERAAARATAC